ncbi:uncharacterized protein EDB93DRAFT_1107810 [Suillus bovinus]|uniref:uncharacterized protein n=1 Tax=Suillus bovinus TaxID=48563 RepID=UPI001B87EE2E|nr:uncharacterized protein EDB93DRAFT_1107810 [Suillus bovinus]KAG2132733.1 hypothetical protein EDB93DRAFT_1107810 [Suillus bovinus]
MLRYMPLKLTLVNALMGHVKTGALSFLLLLNVFDVSLLSFTMIYTEALVTLSMDIYYRQWAQQRLMMLKQRRGQSHKINTLFGVTWDQIIQKKMGIPAGRKVNAIPILTRRFMQTRAEVHVLRRCNIDINCFWSSGVQLGGGFFDLWKDSN